MIGDQLTAISMAERGDDDEGSGGDDKVVTKIYTQQRMAVRLLQIVQLDPKSGSAQSHQWDHNQ